MFLQVSVGKNISIRAGSYRLNAGLGHADGRGGVASDRRIFVYAVWGYLPYGKALAKKMRGPALLLILKSPA